LVVVSIVLTTEDLAGGDIEVKRIIGPIDKESEDLHEAEEEKRREGGGRKEVEGGTLLAI